MSGLLAMVFAATAWAGRCDGLVVREALTCSSVLREQVTPQDPNRISGPYVCPQQHLQSGGEHVYSFRCQQNGPVHLLLEDLQCDLDIYILDESCDTRQGCVGESVAGSNSRDEVTFQCRAGSTYMVIIEGYGYQADAIGRCFGPNAGAYTLRFDVSDETGGCKELCTDGVDNDRDGDVDCDDDDCGGEADCQPNEPQIDTSRLPRTCRVGEACAGEARADQGSQLVIGADGQRLATGPIAGVSAQRIYTEPGTVQWTVHALDASGQPLAAVSHSIVVEQPLILRAPEVLDFGSVKAGTATFADGHCQVLDLSGSQGLDDNVFSLQFTAPAEGCASETVFRGGRTSRPRAVHLPLHGYSLSAQEEICLAVPACAGESVQTATLSIVPEDPNNAGQARDVTMRWTVTERSWLSCNAWWLILLGVTLFTLWVIAGIVRPARFPREASISVAGSDKGLRRSAPQIIRETSRSRSGFYRDAQVGIHADGSVQGRTKGAVLTLRAHRRHGLVITGGAVEIQNRRTRKWEVPEDLAQGHVPSPGSTYRIGDVWFRIEL